MSGQTDPVDTHAHANVDLVIDCNDAKSLGRFWAAALGYDFVGRHEEYVVLMPRTPTHPPLLLQQVAEPKTGKSRVHFDIRTDDVAGEASRLEALGASRIDIGQGPDRDWIVMADPEGNEFCVCPGVPLARES